MISLVDDTFNESRSINDARSSVGNDEKSKGLSINNVTVKIKIAEQNEKAKPRSSTQEGIGRIIIKITVINIMASNMVGLIAALPADFSFFHI